MAEVQLSAFLRTAAARPHVWGETDCVRTLFAWVRATTGTDPTKLFTAQWHSEAEAMAVIASSGGLVEAGRNLFQRCGLRETNDPRRGDVGVIRSAIGDRLVEVAAICTGPRWAFTVEPRGIAAIRGDVLVAWAIGAD